MVNANPDLLTLVKQNGYIQNRKRIEPQTILNELNLFGLFVAREGSTERCELSISNQLTI